MSVKRYSIRKGIREEDPAGMYGYYADYDLLERVAVALRDALVIAEAMAAEKCIVGPADHGKMKAAIARASTLLPERKTK